MRSLNMASWYKRWRPSAPAKIDYAAQDQMRGKDLLSAFISWVNADDEDAITISRSSGCYMRDEIERLRKAAGEKR